MQPVTNNLNYIKIELDYKIKEQESIIKNNRTIEDKLTAFVAGVVFATMAPSLSVGLASIVVFGISSTILSPVTLVISSLSIAMFGFSVYSVKQKQKLKEEATVQRDGLVNFRNNFEDQYFQKLIQDVPTSTTNFASLFELNKLFCEGKELHKAEENLKKEQALWIQRLTDMKRG